MATTLFVSPYILCKPEAAGAGSFAGNTCVNTALSFDLNFASKVCLRTVHTRTDSNDECVCVCCFLLLINALSPPLLGPFLLRKLFGAQSSTQTLMPPGNEVILKTGTQNPLIYESACCWRGHSNTNKTIHCYTCLELEK